MLCGPRDASMTSRLTLVTATDCHLCDHARSVARRLATDLAININEIPWESREADQVRRDGVPFPPALYAGDELLLTSASTASFVEIDDHLGAAEVGK